MDIEINIKRKPKQQANNIIESIQNHTSNNPDKSAFIFLEEDKEQSNITYFDFYNRVCLLASHLNEFSAQRGLLLYPSGIDYVVAFFACILAKVVPVPVYPPTNKRNIGRINSIVNNSQAKLLLSNSEVLGKMNAIDYACTSELHQLNTDKYYNKLTEFSPPEINPEDIAFLQYTSGSISDPKGVILSHSNILHNMNHIQNYFQITSDSVVVSWLPLYHDMGLIGSIISSIHNGTTCVFMSPQSFLQKPYRWLKAISDYNGTVSGAPNFAYEYCVQKINSDSCDELDLSSWNVAFNGAEPVHPETLEKFTKKFIRSGFTKDKFLPCYGMAESTLFVSGCQNFSTLSFDPESYSNNNIKLTDKHKAINLVGFPLPNNKHEICIVNPLTQVNCQDKSIGEIWLKNESVGQGYWNNMDISEETFQAYTACNHGPYLRTGDLGFIHGGDLFVTGRLKDVIIIHGQNYYPQDLEYCVLQTNPAFVANSCAIFSIEHDGEETFVIAIERPRGLKIDFSKVCLKIRTHMVDEFGIQAKNILFVRNGDIPKTSSGKIQHHACRERYLKNSMRIIYEDVYGTVITSQNNITSSETEPQYTKKTQDSDININLNIENYLINLFAKILKHKEHDVTPQHSLFELGLESLGVVEASYRISEDFSISFEPSIMVDTPTIRTLASKITDIISKQKLQGNRLDKLAKGEIG